MSYKTRRYKKGLSGEKNGWLNEFLDDRQGHRAQEAGYRDYLRNKDLVERLREKHSSGSGDSSGYPVTYPPLGLFARVFWTLVGVAFAAGAYGSFTGMVDFESERAKRTYATALSHRIATGDFYARMVGDAIILLLLAYLAYLCVRFAFSSD